MGLKDLLHRALGTGKVAKTPSKTFFSEAICEARLNGPDLARNCQQTGAGDFQTFDPRAATPWIFIRAWEENGFYIETNNAEIEEQPKPQFPTVDEVKGASPPCAGLFIPISYKR